MLVLNHCGRCAAVLAFCVLPAAAQDSFRVSLNSSQEQANGASSLCSASADGRFIAFDSAASNLVSADSNGVGDVFWRDRQFGVTRRVSVATSATQATGASDSPSLSANGRYVAFVSQATNLVAGDLNNAADVFVHDTSDNSTVRVSISSAAAEANGANSGPDISADGRWVTFLSSASNLVAGDTNGKFDVFLRDRTNGTTARVSVGPGNAQANDQCSRPRISDDGRFVCYASDASNLVAGDVNGTRDVFLYDVLAGTTLSVTVNPASLIGNAISYEPEISAAGDWVVFTSLASNLVPGDTNNGYDIFRWRRSNGAFYRASVGAGGQQAGATSSWSSVSGNGLAIVFGSLASNLVGGDTNNVSDVFVHDVPSGLTSRVSVSSLGVQANGASDLATISADGRLIFYRSAASNLVAADSNVATDVFGFGDPCPGATIYCTAKVNSNGCTPTMCSGGLPTLTAPDDFYLTAFRVLNQKSGLFFWGFAPAAAPFGGGTRCVMPVVRAPLQNSGGNLTTNDCSGSYAYHFTDAYMQSWGLTAGTHIFGQFWSRDPFFPVPNNVGLTDAVEITMLP